MSVADLLVKFSEFNINSENLSIRVRQLITQFSYSEFVRTRVIPDISLSTPPIKTKRYPPWLYKLSKSYEGIFSDFGFFVENVIFTTIINQPINYLEIWSQYSSIPIPPELASTNNFIGGIIGWTKTVFQGLVVQHNVELSHGDVRGHPDFLLEANDQTYILDIKTSSSFKNMAEQAYLQILAYCALARASGRRCNFIGLVLPLQRQIIWYDVSNWNHKFYLNSLIREANWVKKDLELFDPANIFIENDPSDIIILSPTIFGFPGRYLKSEILGSHMHKESAFDPSFRDIITPIQIFLSNPRAKGSISSTDIISIVQNTTQNTILFVHAPYIINLCSDEPWSLERLKHELLACQQLGGKGVVVHVGAYTNQTPEQGLDKMEQSIRQALEVATSQCPLLLETPAGEGTELCSGLTQFQSFYARFAGVDNLKICVDSAHIFAASYDPEYYLNSWITKYPGSVALVHFNDSRAKRGSRKDQHYPAGLGYIGYKRMWALHEICRQHNIPMVTE